MASDDTLRGCVVFLGVWQTWLPASLLTSSWTNEQTTLLLGSCRRGSRAAGLSQFYRSRQKFLLLLSRKSTPIQKQADRSRWAIPVHIRRRFLRQAAAGRLMP